VTATWRWRRSLAWAGLVLALLVAGAVITVYVLLQPERFTSLLSERARALGVELTLSQPASPSLWPRPAIELQGINVRGDGGGSILLATRGRIILPWRALLRSETAISRIEFDNPRVDLDALSAAIDALPPGHSGAHPFLPTIDTGLSIQDGTVIRGNAVWLGDVNLDTGELRSDRPFKLALRCKDASGRPLSLDLDAMPHLSDEVLELSDITVAATAGSDLRANLKGSAHWRGAANVSGSVAGDINRGGDDYQASVVMTPANMNDPLTLAIKLDGGADHAHVRIAPLKLAQWWSSLAGNGPLSLPSFEGQVDAAAIDAGPVKIRGLHVRSGADVTLPAPASTVAEK
jgi:AsmA protein